MNTYHPNIGFVSPSDKLEEKIKLNDNCNIIFINRGKEFNNTSVHTGILYELVIESFSDNGANEAVDILNSCLSILEGAPNFELEDLIQNIYYGKSKEIVLPKFGLCFIDDDSPYVASKMACIAENDTKLRVAVLKFNVSQEIFYLHPMDLEPYYNDTYEYQYILSRQIKMGYSIVVSYSILEELQLHVKASSERPSSIDGKWNPDVITDIEVRLTSKGIDPDKKIPWLSRNTQQRPFKKEIEKKELCEWSDGIEVRDFLLSIKEAILEISYVRSQIASHSNSEKVAQLCLYDVENANMLIRSILLDLLKK